MKVSTMLAPSFPGLNSVLNSKSKYSLQAAPGMNKLHHQITYVTEPKNTICSVFTSMFTSKLYKKKAQMEKYLPV